MHGEIEILLMVVVLLLAFYLIGCLVNIKRSMDNYEPKECLIYTLVTIFQLAPNGGPGLHSVQVPNHM